MRLTIHLEHTFEDPAAFMHFAAGFDDLYNKYFGSVPGSVTARPPAPLSPAKPTARANTPLSHAAPSAPSIEQPDNQSATIAAELPPAQESAADVAPLADANTGASASSGDTAAPAPSRPRRGRPSAAEVAARKAEEAAQAQPQLPVAGGSSGQSSVSAPVQSAPENRTPITPAEAADLSRRLAAVAPLVQANKAADEAKYAALPAPQDVGDGEPATLDAIKLAFSRICNLAPAIPPLEQLLKDHGLTKVREVQPPQYGSVLAGLKAIAAQCGV